MGLVTVPLTTDQSVSAAPVGAATIKEAMEGAGYASCPNTTKVQFQGTSPAIPSGALITGVYVTAMVRRRSGVNSSCTVGSDSAGFSTAHSVNSDSFQSFSASGGDLGISSGGGVVASFRVTATGVVGVDVDSIGCQVSYNRAPVAPINLSPVGTSGTLSPTFTGNQSDPDGDSINGIEIEVRKVSNNVLMWASGMLGAGPFGTTFTVGYGGTPLVDGVQYKWRARTKDNANVSNSIGAWSDFVNFTININEAPTASQVSPTDGSTPGTTDPDFTFSFSDPDPGDIFASYQLVVRRVSPQTTFWDTGIVASGAGGLSQITVNYGSVGSATPLVAGTEYEWRVRVYDQLGLASAYTGWRQFTPINAPSPPTGLTPSGKTDTLTPTISGTYVQSTGGTEVGYQYVIRRAGVTQYTSNDITGAIGTGQAYGTNNPSDSPSTPPVLTWGTAYEIRARSKDNAGVYSGWTAWQTFTTNKAPTTPTNVQPNGAITPDTTPDITWQHNDPDGDAQTAVEVEIYDETGAAFVSGYNPKSLTQSALSHTVTTTLTLNRQYRVRVRTRGLTGPGYSPWSTAIYFTVSTAPALTVTNPSVDEVVTGSSLDVTWTFTGGTGIQQDYRVLIYNNDGFATVVYDTGVVVGTALIVTIPAGYIRNNGAYLAHVIIKDTLNQTGQSGLIPFTAAFTPPHVIENLQAIVVGDQT